LRKIYIFSSTVHLDPTFLALVRYGEEELGQGKNSDPQSTEFVFTTFDEDAIHDIMEKSRASIERQAKDKKTLKGSVTLLDDLSHGKWLCENRGRDHSHAFSPRRDTTA